MSNRLPALLAAFGCYSAALAQSPELLEAVRVHRGGTVELARAELQACTGTACPDAPRLSLLLGFLLLSDGAPADAAALLASQPAPKGLEAFHGWYLGEALAWSGQPGAALGALKKARARAPPWLAARIAARQGELLLKLGEAKKAAPLLDAALKGEPSSPELTYQRGLARWLSGEVKKGQADLRAVAVRWPRHPYAERAEAHLRPLAFTFEEHLARAEALGGQRALDELGEVQAPKGREGRLELARAAAYYATGRDALGDDQVAAAAARGPAVAAEALMMRARRLLKKNDNRAAREVLREIDRAYPGEGPAADAAYLAAWLAMQNGDFKAAADDFARFDTEHAGSRKRDEARWFCAYSKYRAGECPVETLKSLIDDFPGSSLVPQGRYWLARCQQKTAGAKVAEQYRAIITAWPGSFYALLASERLRELGETPAPPFAVEPRRLEVGALRELKLAQLLASSGLLNDARREVEQAAAAVRSADQALKLGHALQALGEYGPAYSLAARWLWGAAYTQRQPEAIALLYPRAFAGPVERLSQQHGLDPYLAWAIMRQESAFHPEATSVADARGLMQLIPPTAASIAESRNLEAPDPAELYGPETSISMGTWLLAALLERFAHPSLCAAAYNAGAAPVAQWASARNELPLDEFVEAIPWKETRGYVKNVTANYFVYRTLWARSAEPMRLPLAVPAPRASGVNF